MTTRGSGGPGVLARLLLPLVLVLGAAPATAAGRTVTGRLAGVTTVRWSGVAGIRLQVPADVSMPEAARRLTVHGGGRYAFVRMVPDPQPTGCADTRLTVCAMEWLTWFADVAETVGHGVPGVGDDPPADHYSLLADPPTVRKGGWLLYLFTDTTATLELRAAGLPGRAAYVAGGRVDGAARRLPVSCGALPACDPSSGVAGTASYGGVTVRLPGLGYAESNAYAVIEPEFVAGVGNNQPTAVRACPYPNRYEPSASTAAADHPFGCDAVREPGAPPLEAYHAVVSETTVLGVVAGGFQGWGELDAQGEVYLGWRAASAGPDESRRAGWALWFRYGIR